MRKSHWVNESVSHVLSCEWVIHVCEWVNAYEWMSQWVILTRPLMWMSHPCMWMSKRVWVYESMSHCHMSSYVNESSMYVNESSSYLWRSHPRMWMSKWVIESLSHWLMRVYSFTYMDDSFPPDESSSYMWRSHPRMCMSKRVIFVCKRVNESMSHSHMSSYVSKSCSYMWMSLNETSHIQMWMSTCVILLCEWVNETMSHPLTGWQRCIGCLKLHVSFRKRATIYRALLRKMTHLKQVTHTQGGKDA